MNKTKRIDVKVTEEQFAILNKKASALNLNLSEFMIFCGMNAQISVNIGKLSVFDTFKYELNFLQKMRDNSEISTDEFGRLKADLFKKYTKSAGQ